NEGRAVHRARSLAEGASLVLSVPPVTVSATHEGKLVHVCALATTDETLKDPDFGISAAAIRLSRVAETYQWQEEASSRKRTKLGGGEETTTTYTYKKAWSSRHIDSATFHTPSGHENPPAVQWESTTVYPQRVAFGAFMLPPDLVSKIGGSEVREAEVSDEATMQARGFTPAEAGWFHSGNPSDPQVGDVRVRFEVTRPQTVSIVAAQRGSSLEPYGAKGGSSILLLERGEVSAEAMFKAARTSNTITTWLLRGAGFLLMFIGLALILKPIAVIGSFVPHLGSLLGAGTGLLSFCLALAVSLATMSIAWIAYRPLAAVGLLAVGGVAVVLVLRRRRPKPVVPPPLPAGR
ncbi:MAG: hypothetical protein EHM24_05900, partial [Acidobacteria bacterium]